MKKVMFMMITLMMCLSSFGQWTFKTINNNFDEPFKKAYTKTNNGGFLMLVVGESKWIIENSDTVEIKQPFFALYGTYFCDDETFITIVFIVKGESIKYSVIASKSQDSKTYVFKTVYTDVDGESWSFWNTDVISQFKNASKVLIKVNQEYCDDDYYEFSMSGSAAAFDFITK